MNGPNTFEKQLMLLGFRLNFLGRFLHPQEKDDSWPWAMTLLERTWPWLTELQRNHCGALQAELDRNLPFKVPGKAVHAISFTGDSAGHCTAGARYWRSCIRDRS